MAGLAEALVLEVAAAFFAGTGFFAGLAGALVLEVAAAFFAGAGFLADLAGLLGVGFALAAAFPAFLATLGALGLTGVFLAAGLGFEAFAEVLLVLVLGMGKVVLESGG